MHWAAFTPRFHPSDFEVYTRDGVGADWPITYDDISPYYEQLELEMPVAGPAYYPWGHPHGYPYGPHPMGGVGNALIKGCTALNIPVSIGGPVAILSGSHGDRPHCIYRGFCIQGCKVGAKASTLITHVPDAIQSGAEIRDHSHGLARRAWQGGRVTGVHYFDSDGDSHFQRAKAVIISGYAIETPRLLLNSACQGYENGLGQLQRHGWALPHGAGRQRRTGPLRPAGPHVQGAARACAHRGVLRDRIRRTISPAALRFRQSVLCRMAFGKQMLAAKKAWGWGLRREMMDYNHWAAFGLLGEILPWDDNRVTLAEEKDRFGLPVAHVTFNLHDNDKKLIKAAKEKTMQVMQAAGATEVVQEARYAHLVGAAAWVPIRARRSSTNLAAPTTSRISSSATAAYFPRKAQRILASRSRHSPRARPTI